MKLALDGGTPEVSGPLRQFNTIGDAEALAAIAAVGSGMLSGYLGGQSRGGPQVNRLEDEWAATFGVRHAIAVNSATSGLLAAAFAVGLEPGTEFVCPSFTMSATAAAPMFTGATPIFGDVDERTFCLDVPIPISDTCKAIFVTNLFGGPAALTLWRDIAVTNGIALIEDNSQSPFAMERGCYAGTVGHIGVFSLNVHKHLQCGEGGICVTDDDIFARRMRGFRNHDELGLGEIGLNLRLTEVTAAIALAQLAKAPDIIAGRIAIAEQLTAAVKGLPGITPPYVHPDCRHVYYCWAAKVTGDRDFFVRAMNAEGVPLRAGYVDPLYRLPAFAKFARPCPVAEELHDRTLVIFENCAYDPTPQQIKQIGCAFEKVTSAIDGLQTSRGS